MVGIAGGAPSKKHDIRLGDVVVSMPGQGQSGVIFYDFGKAVQSRGFEMTGHLDKPPAILRAAVARLQESHELETHSIEESVRSRLHSAKLRKAYQRPDLQTDKLYRPEHEHGDGCCEDATDDETGRIVRRNVRDDDDDDNLVIHYGLVASGNKLMRDALMRDQLSAEHDILCFEMEAAGLMNNFPCLVIRGICDYSDTHKNKRWQKFAAMVAAAYARDLLLQVASKSVEAQDKISKIVLSSLSRTENKVESLRFRLQKTEDLQILNWVTPVDYGPQQSDFLARRQPDSGEWFFESKEYREWLREPKSTLFCPGMPGAGKTILSSIVVNDLHQRNATSPSIGIAFVFCNFRRGAEQSAKQLLSSLLKQVSESCESLPACVQKLHSDHRRKRTLPSLDEVSDALKTVAEMYSRVYVVVDALDECQVSNGNRAVFLSKLSTIQVCTTMNILATSRFNTEIEKYLPHYTTLEIRATSSDIDRYVTDQIRYLPSFIQKHDELRCEVISKICGVVDGMFLLAKLHLDALRQALSIKAVRHAINNLTTGDSAYLDAYEEAIGRVLSQPPEQAQLAMRVLAWISCAKRPLETDELYYALSVRIGSKEFDSDDLIQIDLVSICAGLVTIDEAKSVIRLVHYTTQEYFQQTWTRWFPQAHREMTEVCVTCLSSDSHRNSKPPDRPRNLQYGLKHAGPLYGYAAQHWGFHATEAGMDVNESDLVLTFLKDDTLVSLASEFCDGRPFHRRKMDWSGLHLVSFFGIASWMDTLLQFFDVNIANADLETALHIAAMYGHKAVICQLLQRGAFMETSDSRGQTPLAVAGDCGHLAVVDELLRQGADVNGGCNHASTPLHEACKSHHEKVARRLLEAGPDLRAVDFESRTSLHCAASSGLEAIVMMMLAQGAEVNAMSRYGTPLHCAVGNGHEAVAKALLGSGANPNTIPPGRESRGRKDSSYRDGSTPLGRAAENGSVSLVSMLLKYGAAPDLASDRLRLSPAHQAVRSGHDYVLVKLFDHGANVDPRDSSQRTPLHLAVRGSNLATMNLLLDRGADIDAQDTEGWAPLHLAAGGGPLANMELLLKRGADIEARDLEGWTPLHHATRGNHPDGVRLLISQGAGVEVRDNDGLTPLRSALSRYRDYGRKWQPIRVLLKLGADLLSLGEFEQELLLEMTGYADIELLGRSRDDPNVPAAMASYR